MNNFTAATSQKFKLCSCFMLQDYIMTGLDKQFLHKTSKHHLWSDLSVFRLTEVFCGDVDITILKDHFLLLWWAVNVSESHPALHCMPKYFYFDPELGQIQCLSWDWFLSLMIYRLRLKICSVICVLVWPLCLTVHYQFSRLAVFTCSHLPNELFLLVQF